MPLPGAPAAEEPVTPVAAACADVLEALTDAVIRYEMMALAEASGSGSRSVAAAEMLALIERARAAAYSQAGVPSAAAPAINSVIALRADSTPWRRWTRTTPRRGADRGTTSRPGARRRADRGTRPEPSVGRITRPCTVATGSDTPDRVGKGLWRSW